MSKTKFTTEVGGRQLEVEVGKLAKQAHGACTVTYGETVVLATAVTSRQPREGIDFIASPIKTISSLRIGQERARKPIEIRFHTGIA